jgi:hypothetical protein
MPWTLREPLYGSHPWVSSRLKMDKDRRPPGHFKKLLVLDQTNGLFDCLDMGGCGSIRQ